MGIIKACIFDLGGTIVDKYSLTPIIAFRNAFLKHKVILPKHSIINYMGMNKKEHIQKGVTKITSLARLQEIKSGKLKKLVNNHKLFVDGSHNPLGAKVLNQYLQSLNCNKHIIIGMMANKDHNEYMKYFKDISSVTTIDIPNQPNSISGKELMNKLNSFNNIQYKDNINEAIKSISLKQNDIILITGSLYLAGEILKLN